MCAYIYNYYYDSVKQWIWFMSSIRENKVTLNLELFLKF